MDETVKVVLAIRRMGSPYPYEAPSGKVYMIYRGVDNRVPVEDADGIEDYEGQYWCMRERNWRVCKPFKVIL